MKMKRKLLNVRTHLEHLNEVLEGIEKHGLCPLIKHELAVLGLVNRAILASHKAKNTRKDIRIPTQNTEKMS